MILASASRWNYGSEIHERNQNHFQTFGTYGAYCPKETNATLCILTLIEVMLHAYLPTQFHSSMYNLIIETQSEQTLTC
jgi:hypothetical protein